MSGITASLAPALAEAEGVLVPVGAQALEGALVREGQLREHQLSLLRGGVLTPRPYDHGSRVVTWLIVMFILFSCFV